jgi:hypothetical protein
MSGGPPAGEIPLHCLGGRGAPPDLGRDLRLVLRLPERAREHFWDALGPALAEPLPSSVEGLLDRFCRSFGIPDEELLARSIKACRFLVRAAVAADLSPALLGEDIARLLGGPASPEAAILAPLLLSRYDEARAAVREEIVRKSIADHGLLLEGVQWRVDRVARSSHGKVGIPVAVLTLQYRQGDRSDRITLQLLPDMVEALRRACEDVTS